MPGFSPTSEELHSVLIYVESVLHKDLCKLLAKLSIENASDQTVVYRDPNIALSIVLKKHVDEVKSIEALNYPSNQPKIFESGNIKKSINILDLDTTLIQSILRNVSCFVTCKGKGKSECKDLQHHINSGCCQNCDHSCILCYSDPCQNCCMNQHQKCNHSTPNGKCLECKKKKCEECCLTKKKSCNHSCNKNTCREKKLVCLLFSKALCSTCGTCLYCARLNPKVCCDKELAMFEGICDEKMIRNIISHWTAETGKKFVDENKPFEDFPQLNDWDSLKKHIILTQKRILRYLSNANNFQHQQPMSSQEIKNRTIHLQFILNNRDRREVEYQLKASMFKMMAFIKEENNDSQSIKLIQNIETTIKKTLREKQGECLNNIESFDHVEVLRFE